MVRDGTSLAHGHLGFLRLKLLELLRIEKVMEEAIEPTGGVLESLAFGDAEVSAKLAYFSSVSLVRVVP